MNALDVLSLLIVFLFSGLGIYHGLIKSISSLASIIIALSLAKNLSPALAEILSYIHIPNLNGLIGFLIIFFFFFLIAKILFHIIQKFWKKSALSLIDRVLGGILGFAKGVIITIIIFAAMQLILPKDSAILTDSSLVPYSNKIIVISKGLVPQDIYKYFKQEKK